jgi:carbohydrate diacid regulator
MISNQILQTTINGMKTIVGREFCISDPEGNLLASTFGAEDRALEEAATFAKTQAESQVAYGFQYFKVFDEEHLEYILMVEGEDSEVTMIGRTVVFQLQNLLVAYQERFDRDNFIKNLLLDNLLLVDIYNRAKKLHIDSQARRVVFLIETTREKEVSDVDKLRSVFGSRAKDFITAVDETSIVLVRELLDDESYDEMESFAEEVYTELMTEGHPEIHIAYGTIIKELREVSKSYKEARMALDVGKIFFEEKNVVAYSKLGIGRLIYQLPIPLCKMFIKEIFHGISPESFDEETLTTINKFFENNLNVSETSRQIFIHRNTLVYRLDKLQKSTGLDIRTFEDAITFKIALMVVKYMKHMENEEF